MKNSVDICGHAVGMLWAAMPRAGQQWHVKLPIASLSKCLDWGAMPRPCQGKACQGTKCQGKACQGTTCQGKTCQGKACQASNSLTFLKCLEWGNAKAKARQGMSRPRHAKAKARHANARQGKACQGHAQASNSLTFSKCLEWGNAKAKPRQGKACQGQGMPSFQ